MIENKDSGQEDKSKELAEEFEAQPRKLGRREDIIFGVFMIALSVFQLYTAWQGAFAELIQRSVHLFFILPAAFIIYPAFRKSAKRDKMFLIEKLFILMIAVSTLWVTFNNERISYNWGSSSTIDLLLAPILIIAILEAARRILGPVLPILVLLLVAYALLGPFLPGDFAHRGFSLKMVLESLYLEPDGIFGSVLGISATVIAGFLIFGVILSETGGGETFVDLAKKLAGRSHGGPAKVSCFSSAFFGTISGSAVANVVVDGVFNIPLMKSLGYKKEFAAGVEATTSTGGQLMPPVMGAGAFVMASILEIPYAKVALSAVIPAVLYYAGCFFGVHFSAQKQGLKPLPREEIPSFRKKILPRSGPFIIPVSALIYFLSIGRNPSLSVFYALVLSVLSYLIFPAPEQAFSTKLKKIFKALDQGGRAIVMVAALCACAQMVVALLNSTGMGVKVSELVAGISGGNVYIVLILTMVVAIILGMGVPTTAAYVLAASVCVPPLLKFGMEPLPAHMFVFYFAILSSITPPVCGAVYAAAAIAQSNWLKTAIVACKLGFAGFIVPYMFYFAPTLLLQGDLLHIIQNSGTALVGVVCISASTIGFLRRPLSWPERVILFIAGLMFVDPGLYTDIIGSVILIYMYFSERFGFSVSGWKERFKRNIE